MATALDEMKAACKASDDAIAQREYVLLQLQPLPRPDPALPYWAAIAFAIGVAIGAAVVWGLS